MTFLPLQARRYLISLIGTLIFLPVYIFWGGVFSFSYTPAESIWAWGFGLIACWGQILAILASFFNPRRAAYWMILNTSLSIMLAVGYAVASFHGHLGAPDHNGPLFHDGFDILKTGLIFWVPPSIFASLLLRNSAREQDGCD